MIICTECETVWSSKLLACARCKRPGTLVPFGSLPEHADHPLGRQFPIQKMLARRAAMGGAEEQGDVAVRSATTWPRPPAPQASEASWRAYAEGVGLAVEGLTKAEIRALVDEALAAVADKEETAA